MFLLYLAKMGLPDWASKLVEALVLCAVIALSYYGVFLYGESKEKAVYETKISAYDAALKSAQDGAKEDLKAMSAQHDTLVQSLNTRLADSEKRKHEVQVVIKEVTKYVTEKADSECVITAGFGWVWNKSLTTEYAGIPLSIPGNVDAPTTLKVSDLSSIAAENNSECAQRGEVIADWQLWYNDTKKLWDLTAYKLPKPPALLK